MRGPVGGWANRRRAATAVAGALLGLLASAGCSSGGTASAQESPACGLVSSTAVTGLMGTGLHARHTGDPAALRRGHGAYTCVTRGRHAVHTFTIKVLRHPAPLQLDTRPCRTGWVYAGTPDDNAPACQEAIGSGGRSRLLVRHGAYVLVLTVDRSDRNWAGDPEVTLGMVDRIAHRLHLTR